MLNKTIYNNNTNNNIKGHTMIHDDVSTQQRCIFAIK